MALAIYLYLSSTNFFLFWKQRYSQRQRVDSSILKKIAECMDTGVNSVREVKKHLESPHMRMRPTSSPSVLESYHFKGKEGENELQKSGIMVYLKAADND